MARYWQERSDRVSTQVLNEFYVNLVRIKGDEFKVCARAEIRHLMASHPCAINAIMLKTARGIADDKSISHCDALIVAAALHQGCETLLSEDLQHGQIIEGVRVVNPFRAAK